ncbi:MAG: hypothetical protein ACLFVG_03155 [Candidatus Aminicenantes bacterium]
MNKKEGKTKEERLSRREFFAEAAKGAVVMSCLGVGVESAWAQYMKTGKPLLTVKNLNEFYKEKWTKPEFDKLVKEAKSDLPRFLNSHFSLTDKQKQYLKTRYVKDKEKIGNFVNNVAEKTRSHLRSKAAGTPGQFVAVSEGKQCSEGQSWKCFKIDLLTFSVEYCYCA